MSLSARIQAADRAFGGVRAFYLDSRYSEARFEPDVCDFTFGNPHEMPLEPLVSAIRERAIPKDENWFAYKSSEEEPQAFLAERLREELGLPFEPQDVALTAGAFAAIVVAVHLVLDVGDEAVISEPAWFCYEPIVHAAGAVPRKVSLAGERFDLDIAAIEAAIGPRTRLVIVTTPHNPTGRIYPREALAELADMLERASRRIGHRICLLSDEPYRRLRFDGRGFVSPAAIYPWTFVSYSYGKVLLAPGQRLGYLAISPLMPAPERQAHQEALFSAQMALGWCFPNAVMQYSVPDLEHVSIDLQALARRRDVLMRALGEAGYQALEPEGTFYLWCRWPGDPERLFGALAERNVFVMPGALLGSPTHFRISLTASDDMVERAIPHFQSVVAG